VLSRKRTRAIAVGVTAVVMVLVAFVIVNATAKKRLGNLIDRRVILGDGIGPARARRTGIQRPVRPGRRRNVRHGRQRVNVAPDAVDTSR